MITATLSLLLLQLTVQKSPTAGALAEDCNGNGVPDRIDIAVGTSKDCQHDGIPDECQLATAFAYQYDDGEFDGGVGTNHDHIAWLTSHVVQPGHEVVSGIEIAWGQMGPAAPVTVGLWSDPNGDGDPTDAQLIAAVPTVSSLEFSGTFVSLDLPDTFLGPAGTSFFVGAYGQFDQTWFPAGFDIDMPDGTSWFISSDTPLDPNNLSAGAIAEFGVLSSVCGCDGDWTVRAIDCPTGHCGESADLNQNGVPDECDPDCDADGLPDDYELLVGSATDCNFDLVPDDCQGLPDCDGNGLFDVCQSLAPQGLVGSYYANEELSGPPLARVDPNVFFDFDATPPFPGLFPTDHFSVRWSGALTTYGAGTYTFGVLHDDGVRLWVNGQKILDEWHSSAGSFDTATIDLAAATEYYVVLEFYEGNGNAVVELHWQPPGGIMGVMLPTELQPIYDKNDDGVPDGCQVPDCNGNGVDDGEDIAFGTSDDCDGNALPDECQPCEDCDGNGMLDSCELVAGPGLVGQYFHAKIGTPTVFLERIDTLIDPNVDFDWSSGPPLPGYPNDDFGVRWTGTLTTPAASGTYAFHVQADDGVRFWLDGVLLVDEWHPSSGTEYTASIPLVGGTPHVLQLDYYEAGGDAKVHLRWTEPGGTKVAVPQSALTADTDVNGDGIPDLCTQDCNLNGIPDPLETDANGNCIPDSCEGGTGYWRFEEAGGATIQDSTSTGLHGTLNPLPFRVGDVPASVVPLTGAANLQALHLNWQSIASGGAAGVPDVGGYLSVPATGFTLEGWVKLDHVSTTASTDERQWLFMKKPAAGSDALLEYGLLAQAGNLGGTGRELAFRYGDGVNVFGVTSALAIADTEWHFVSVAYDPIARKLRFGLDDAFEEVTLDKPVLSNAGPLTVGAHENQSGVQNQFLRGTIDELRFTRAFLPPALLLDPAP